MLKLISALPLILTLGLVACSGDDEPPPATPTSERTVVATTAPSSTPPALTATATQAASQPSVTPTSIGTNAPPVDGTVAPQNAGDVTPVTIKANPDPASKIGVLKDVRVGAHPEQGGWDRIVFEFTDILPPGEVKYVKSASQCGSGEAVKLPGSAILQVSFTGTDAHNEAGQSTIKSRQITGPGNVLLESQQICDFEAHVNWALSLKAQQRFKVTLLQNPTRVVIDIKQ